jgi:hypothetical protein
VHPTGWQFGQQLSRWIVLVQKHHLYLGMTAGTPGHDRSCLASDQKTFGFDRDPCCSYRHRFAPEIAACRTASNERILPGSTAKRP